MKDEYKKKKKYNTRDGRISETPEIKRIFKTKKELETRIEQIDFNLMMSNIELQVLEELYKRNVFPCSCRIEPMEIDQKND